MHKNNATANFDVRQILLDCIVILLAYILSGIIYYAFRGSYPGSSNTWIYVIYTVVFVLSMLIQRMYNITTFYYMNRVIQRSIFSTLLSALCISAVIFLSKNVAASRLFFLIFCVLGLSMVILARMLVRWTLSAHIGNGYTHVLFIGDEKTKEQYLRYTEKTAMKISVDRHIGYDDTALGSVTEFEKLLKSLSVHEVMFVYTARDNRVNMKEMMGVCEDMGITVRLVLELFDLPNSRRFVSSVGTYPVLTYHSVSFDKISLFVKSVIDIIGALVGLALFSLVFLAVAAAIKLESPGPVFFIQTRIGQNGRPFKMYKFRSMYRDADAHKKDLMTHNKIRGGFMFKMDNDPRITRVGAFIRKTSIDELPQLLNVLMRNMSLVGTRPPTPDEVERYNRGHWRRISIKPGITGMWQTCGRSDILDFEDVVALDKKYIDEWSLALDFKLIWKTAAAVLMRRGAS